MYAIIFAVNVRRRNAVEDEMTDEEFQDLPNPLEVTGTSALPGVRRSLIALLEGKADERLMVPDLPVVSLRVDDPELREGFQDWVRCNDRGGSIAIV